MVLVTPTFAAVVGAAWAMSHPAIAIVRHGVAVPARQSVWTILGSALVAGGLGVLVVVAAVFVAVYLRYRLAGNPAWEIVYTGAHAAPPMLFFELHSRGDLPIDPVTLGPMECQIRTPSGMWESRAGDLSPRFNPPGVVARPPLTPEAGWYEARWHAERGTGRIHEIARVRVELDANGTLVRPTRASALGDVWRWVVR
jgi:hypothetical protein